MEIKQNSTTPLLFLLVDSTDLKTPETGLSPTVTISKDGGAFSSPAGSSTEVGNGIYKLTPTSADTNTLRSLALHATAAGAHCSPMLFEVVSHTRAEVIAAIAALNNLSAAQVRTELDTELAYIDAAISSRNDTAPPSALSVATQVRSELATELGRIDATISSRNAATPPTAAAVATQVRAELGAELTRIDATISSRNATAPPSAESVAAQVRSQLATELGRIDATVSSRNATAPDNAGIAAVKSKTDALPTDPADQSLIIAATDAVMARLGTPAGASISADIASVDAGGGATPAQIADAVCDEILAGHIIPGSVGSALAAASASGDPWASVVPSLYPDGTAGAAIGRLNNTPAAAPVIVVPGPPTDDSLTVCYCYTENITNTARAGIVLTFRLMAVPAKSERLLEVAPATATTDASGYAAVTLQSGLRYRLTSRDLGLDKTFTPTGATFDLLTLIP